MIIPVMENKRYAYGRFFRIFWFSGFIFTMLMMGLVWFIWPDANPGWLWLVEGLILLYSFYSGWSWLATFAHVVLTDEQVIVHQFGRTTAISYETITNIRRTQIALILQAQGRTIFLERHISEVFDLMGELKYRAPALQVDRQALIRQPLPQTFNGRFRAFLFSLGISLLCGFVGAGIIWSAFDEAAFQMVLMFFFGLWPLLISGLFLYLSFYFTWRLTLLPDKIVIRFPFHKQEITVEMLASLRVLTLQSNRSPEPTQVLLLTLADGRSRRISQQEMPVPIPHLLEMMVHHYQLPLRYEKEAEKVHHTEFGAGSRRPFAEYLNGASRVQVQSIDDISRWLQQCQYVRDAELFGQRDVWQHPGEFETRRQGDCEDHALWAWRKLGELNVPAEFVVGRVQWGEVGDGVHAWVAYEENGRSYILESTHKKQIIYPLETIQTRYHPWFSVDAAGQTYRFVPVAARDNGSQ